MGPCGNPIPYPGEVSTPNLLQPLLDRMAQQAPSREPAPLLAFREALRRRDLAALRQCLPELEARQLLEEAMERFRQSVREAPSLMALKSELEPLTEKARARRSALWQLDARRVKVRLRFSRGPAVAALGTPELQALLVEALRLEGLRPALELCRNPKPLLQVHPPLSVGVLGLEECAEGELTEPPREPAEAFVPRLNARLPEDLEITTWEELPTWASPLSELAREAHYTWPLSGVEGDLQDRVRAFLEAPTFTHGKAGKTEGKKGEKLVDLRPHVTEMTLDRAHLRFTMPLSAGIALNPLKLLAAITGFEAGSLQGLCREAIALREDPRRTQAERFETKLKNIYEDATLLTSGGNITLVDEDDDEPLQLG